MVKKIAHIGLFLCFCFWQCAAVTAQAATTVVTIDDPLTWTAQELSRYIGQTVTFTTPFYVINNYRNTYTVSPRRIFSATNQAIPRSDEYNRIVELNSHGAITLYDVSGYHRMGERLTNLTVKVNSSYNANLLSCTWEGNSREDLAQGYDRQAVNARGQHTLLVCAMNLRYYLTDAFGTGYGPDDAAAHQRQRTKIRQALSTINADIYGLLEVQQGQDAMRELAEDLTAATGRHFTYIHDNTTVSGSYTKSGYVYCTDVVKTDGNYRSNNTAVYHRKFMQAFKMKENNESFIFSINHFKSKSGSGSGLDADQCDGQGAYNHTRTQEAQSVVSEYNSNKNYYDDDDILIMGDLNAYAQEDPVRVFKQAGMEDLHRYFHADSSYSYVYHGEAGYLDHALCNATLLPQVTGMTVFHINSDESDTYSYYSSTDQTMFRSSDHDPVIVGLALGQTTPVQPVVANTAEVLTNNGQLIARNAPEGHLRIYSIEGMTVYDTLLHAEDACSVPTDNWRSGLYIIHLYHDGQVIQQKMLIR